MSDEKLELFEEAPDDGVESGGEAAEQAVEAPEDPQKEVAEALEAEGDVSEGTGEDQAAPPAATEEKQQGHIPVTALLDEREKRQAAEREVAELRQWRQQQEQLQRQSQQPPPDWYDDPEKRMQVERAQTAHMLWNERLNMSEMTVRSQVGDELVDAATQAFTVATQTNPALYQEMQSQRHPYDFVVKWHQRQSILTEIGDNPKAWMEAQREQIRAEMAAENSQPPPVKAPPGSLASAPSAKGQEPAAVDAPSDLRGLFSA